MARAIEMSGELLIRLINNSGAEESTSWIRPASVAIRLALVTVEWRKNGGR